MCTYLTMTADVVGSGSRGGEDWFSIQRAVVSFDHPQDALAEHALCLDVRGGEGDRLAVELDAASARRLAETILAVLDADGAKVLQ
ncbi:MAG TPA: DUF6295 family protein [Acidimicrobiales bacterium]|nr:DUF6295 family protein [Acidimicrobiales bacterium]